MIRLIQRWLRPREAPLFRKGDRVELLAPAPTYKGVWTPCGSRGNVVRMYADNYGCEIDIDRPIKATVFADAVAVRKLA